MSTKHTPGPWRISTANPFAVNTSEAGIATAHGIDDANYSEFFPSTEQAKANARLIAAAPELLAALKDTFDALLREKIAYNQRMGADYETAHKHALLSNDFAAARAAIAKATGNTSADL